MKIMQILYKPINRIVKCIMSVASLASLSSISVVMGRFDPVLKNLTS